MKNHYHMTSDVTDESRYDLTVFRQGLLMIALNLDDITKDCARFHEIKRMLRFTIG